VLLSDLRLNSFARCVAELDCVDTKGCIGPIEILLECLSPPNGIQFARVNPHEICDVTSVKRKHKGVMLPVKTLYVRQSLKCCNFNPSACFLYINSIFQHFHRQRAVISPAFTRSTGGAIKTELCTYQTRQSELLVLFCSDTRGKSYFLLW
jgi:hypothetical protein